MGIISSGIYFLKVKENKRKNRFDYNMADYSQVHPDFIKFKEHESLIIDAKELHAMAIDRNDNIYVATETSIIIFNKVFKKMLQITTPGSAYCIEISNDDFIYAGFENTITIFNQIGDVLNTLKLDSKKSIITAICSTDEYIFVADAGKRQIRRFKKDKNNPEKLLLDDISHRFKKFIIPSAFFDIKKGLNESLWIANTGKHALENYTYDGRLISSWTRATIRIEGFSGCCNPAHIAIGSDGSIITSEKGLNRIKTYSPTGELTNVVAGPQIIAHYIENPDIAVNSEDVIFLLDNTVKQVRIFKKI